MWYREKDRWKNSRPTAFDDSEAASAVKASREKAWKLKEPLAKVFGVERKEYDLDDDVKKITRFSPKNVDGVPIVEKETFYLKRPFRYDRPLSASERKILPLPQTSCCRWVGLTDFPVGAWPQKFREPLGWFDGISDSKHLDPLLSGKKDRLLSRYTLIEGSWATNRSLLQEMATPPPSTVNASVYDLIDFSIDRIEKFGLPQISSVIEKWWLKAVTMNSQANPGLVTRREIGSTKEKAYGGSLIIAQRLWDVIVTSRSPVCDHSLWSVGGRARKQDMSKGKTPESRMVLMPETPNSLIASVISQPIIKEMKKVLSTNPSSECFMGQDVTLGGWKRISDFTTPGTPTLELDWSKFDSTVTENTLVAAFCFLRTCFPESRKIDKLFLFVMSSTVYKNVAVKQRFIYRITRGVPSGSPLTSLLVTLANWISLNYVLRKSGIFGVSGPDDYKLAVAGDDTLISFLNKDTFKVEDAKHVTDTFKSLTNLSCKPEDLNFNEWFGGELYSTDDIEFAPSLLKTTIWQGLPGRRLDDLVKAISCPESAIRSYWDVLDVLKGYTSIPIYNPLGRALMRTLGKFVDEKLCLQTGVDNIPECYDPFSESTYLPKFENLVVIDDVSDRLLRDPPYLRKDKWKGEQLSDWRAGLFSLTDLGLFGVPP